RDRANPRSALRCASIATTRPAHELADGVTLNPYRPHNQAAAKPPVPRQLAKPSSTDLEHGPTAHAGAQGAGQLATHLMHRVLAPRRFRRNRVHGPRLAAPRDEP